MTTLDKLLQVYHPCKHLIHDLVLLFKFLALWPVLPRTENALIYQKFFDNWTELDQLLVDRVHKQTELLLHLLF